MKKLLVLCALVAGISVFATDSANADHRRSGSSRSFSRSPIVIRSYSYPSRFRSYNYSYSPYRRFSSYGYGSRYGYGYRPSGFSIQFGRGIGFRYCR
ncbi:MAG: hypothetical protein CMJ78_19400 [Planctomycetaceae bacterium]|nr:hypothetical protein [Planctomycetaceae bacterium]